MDSGRCAGRCCSAICPQSERIGQFFCELSDNCTISSLVGWNSLFCVFAFCDILIKFCILYRRNGHSARTWRHQGDPTRPSAVRWTGKCVEHVFQGQRCSFANRQRRPPIVSGYLVFPTGARELFFFFFYCNCRKSSCAYSYMYMVLVFPSPLSFRVRQSQIVAANEDCIGESLRRF